MMMTKIKHILFLFLVCGIISSCSSAKEQQLNPSAEILYNQAYEQLQQTSYKKAAETFEKVELEHPYSKWAVKAKLMGGYAYYKDGSYDDAVISFDRFIKFHPGNKDIAYAYYMKAICYYDQIADVTKDQSNTARAMAALEQVILRFPGTPYAQDASMKIALTNDHLAGKEMEVGRYYLEQKNYLSALNRFSTVVNNYQTTAHIEEALYRQVELYTILGLNGEAGKAYRVLEYNYPKSGWTAQAVKIINTQGADA